MSKFEETAKSEHEILKSLDELKSGVSDHIDAANSLGYDNMVCVIITKKNMDGTYGINIISVPEGQINTIKFAQTFISEININKLEG